MKRMKTILVDDEPMALEVLKHMLSPYKEIDIVGSYSKHTDVLKNLKETNPELIFLDIEMGDMNGLELAEAIIRKLEDVEIIFVTAYSQYAVDAFEINAIDYLLKPIQEKRLEKAINRTKEKRLEKNRCKKIEKSSSDFKVYSFGKFQVIDDEENTLNWRTRKTGELFAYLWIHKERVSSKDLIIDSIFPDKKLDKASTILHTTVYQLRKSLEKLGYTNAIIYSEEGYQLDIPIESDLKDLKSIMEQDIYSEKDIKTILEIYRGDFLEEGYNWAMELQETYRHLVFKILAEFAKKEIKNKNFSAVLKISLDKLYEIDPFSNSVIQMMVDFYGKQNETTNLKIFFKNFKKTLWKELELKPDESIINTYNRYINT